MPKKSQAVPAVKEPSLKDLLAKRGGKYLSDDEKRDFSDLHIPFTITDVAKGKGTFGTRWELTFRDANYKRDRIITIPTHELRDDTIGQLAKMVEKKGPQGPVALQVREMENGHSWLSLVFVDEKKGE